MVEDNQIKAQISPFAIREGEIKTFDGKDGYVSMNQIVHKINIGHINEIHFAILDLVNEFEFITSRQLYQMLEIKGFDPKSQDKLNNKLEQLVKSKILTRYYFTSEEGKGIYRIYCLEKMGKYLLNSKETECKWQPSDNTKPVAMIKKRLAGNQTLIAYLRKVKAFDSYIVKPAINAKIAGKVFKATGGAVKLTKNGKSIQFVFEAIRREQDWKKKLIDKMILYKDFYENFVPGDSGFSGMPQLILICEDEKHMAEAFKEIVTNQVEIPQIKLYFTTDLRQNEETLENTLVEFKLENGKYKENPFEYEEKTDKKTTKKTDKKTTKKTDKKTTKKMKTKPQEKDILSFCKEAKTLREIAEHFGFKDIATFRKNYLNSLIENNKIKMTIPNQPKNKNQKYVTILQK